MTILNDTTFLVFFALVAVISALLAAGVVWLLVRRRQRTSQTVETDQVLLEEARQQSQEIIRGAETKAEEIVQDTMVFNKKVQAELTETLRTTVKQAATQSDQRMMTLLEAHDKEAQAAVDSIKQSAMTHIEDIAGKLTNQVVTIERRLEQAASEEQQKFRAELAETKKEQLRALEERLAKQLPKVVQSLVGRAIPLKEHEKLVHEALEQASQEGWSDPQ